MYLYELEGKVKNNMKFTKEDFDKISIWWNLAYNNGDTEVYDKCNDTVYNLIGQHIEQYRYKKLSKKWEDMKMNTLCYVPEHYLNTNGILSYYYTKDDIIRLCDENKVVGKHVFNNIKGERVEDYIDSLKEQYFQYFTEEETANIYKSSLSVNMFRILTKEQKDFIHTILDEKTGKRKDDKVIGKGEI